MITPLINKLKTKSFLVVLLLVSFYLITHLYGLTKLPVFADESIYIRWSQLIIDDWQRYLFFPLNDGKTPLQMWLMTPLQFMFSDQLYAGRFLSVLAGLGQIFVIGQIIKSLGGRKKTQWLGMFLTTILPFWFFHHRIALIDALLTLFLSMIFLFLVKLTQDFTKKLPLTLQLSKSLVFRLFFAGVFFGLALFTKLPAILFLPVFPIIALLPEKLSLKNRFKLLLPISASAFMGMLIFASLKLHPAFGQLFSRGGDFLFSLEEVFQQGEWQQSLKNIPKFFSFFNAYLTLPIIILSFSGLFLDKIRRKQAVLILSALAFLAPIILLGKVVYPRYLMPAVIFITVSATLSTQVLIDRFVTRGKKLYKKVLVGLVIIQLFSATLMSSFDFMSKALFSPNSLPLVKIDKIQYLYEWSSGHGILETTSQIKKIAQNKKIIIATEGYFGTLPDALLMYLHRRDVSNIFIQGIGQPVREIPEEFSQKAQNFDVVWLVVNSHRMKINLPQEKLVSEFCRPNNAPCLQIWDIKQFIEKN